MTCATGADSKAQRSGQTPGLLNAYSPSASSARPTIILCPSITSPKTTLALARRTIEAENWTAKPLALAQLTGKLLVASSAGDLADWARRLLFPAPDETGTDRRRLWFVFHSLQRNPKLLQRRRLRRRRERA